MRRHLAFNPRFIMLHLYYTFSICLIFPLLFCFLYLTPGLRLLTAYFNKYARDPVTMQLRPNCFADLAEHLVIQAVPLAAAQAVNLMGESDPVRMRMRMRTGRERGFGFECGGMKAGLNRHR